MGVRTVWISVFFIAAVNAQAFSTNKQKNLQKRSVNDRIAFAIETEALNMKSLSLQHGLKSVEHLFEITDENGKRLSIIVADANYNKAFANAFSRQEGLRWVQPTYEYIGDPREYSPNDPQLAMQEHHEIMMNPLAWNVTLGSKEIVVAVTDDGIETTHEDLATNIWKNLGEIPDNGIDDDNNGYVDDYLGWNFSIDTNDSGASGTHGTHVAGIINATADNGLGVVGTAPNVKVMSAKFYDYSGSWTSEVIAKTYAYAVDNGAQIITTSYNIDGFVGDQLFQAAITYVYQNGLIHFNSAGNGYADSPRRLTFQELIFVCSTEAVAGEEDKKSAFSNYGIDVDLCAPGGKILSTVVNNAYARLSGTSMATPNAAAVAALIWSNNPTWNREQVIAQLKGNTDDIDSVNPAYLGKLGTGRVNTYKALTATLAAPKFLSFDVENFKLLTHSTFASGTVNTDGAFMLQGAGADAILGTNDDTHDALPLSIVYRTGSNLLHFDKTSLAPGKYRLIGSALILQDPFGVSLDGNGDGIAGDDFVVDFEIL